MVIPPVVAGLLAAFVLVVAIGGLRMSRADALEGWDVGDLVLLRDEQRKRRRESLLDGMAKKYAPKLADLIGPRRVGDLRRRIDLAGRPDGMTVESFLGVVVKYFVVLGAAGFALLLLGSYLGALLAFALAPVLPLLRIVTPMRARRARIDTDLPDFLDVLAVTVAAGIGFRTALGRVTARFDGPLREEMSLTLQQLDVGVPRRQAFDGLRRRCDSESMSSFVSAFLQAEELGAPLAESLTMIARDSRREAAQNARRRAARVVPRVTLVVSMILVPPTVLLVLAGMYLGSGIDALEFFRG